MRENFYRQLAYFLRSNWRDSGKRIPEKFRDAQSGNGSAKFPSDTPIVTANVVCEREKLIRDAWRSVRVPAARLANERKNLPRFFPRFSKRLYPGPCGGRLDFASFQIEASFLSG